MVSVRGDKTMMIDWKVMSSAADLKTRQQLQPISKSKPELKQRLWSHTYAVSDGDASRWWNVHCPAGASTQNKSLPAYIFSYHPLYLFSINGSRHFFDANHSPTVYYDIFVFTVHVVVIVCCLRRVKSWLTLPLPLTSQHVRQLINALPRSSRAS